MNILLPVSSFHHLTGSELYVYELGRELVQRGHRVLVASNRIEGAMAPHAKAAGILTCRFEDFSALTQIDMIHASEEAPTRWALAHRPHTPIICTVHSQYPCEKPVNDPRILHYVCVRPEVQEKIVNEDGIPFGRTSVIYNPIDLVRFYPEPAGPNAPHPTPRVLFCGTMDRLRRATIQDLIRHSIRERFHLRLVGRKADDYNGYLENLPLGTVSWQDQTWDIAPHIHWCDETAGVLLGRTTIEGWACGKPGWIYDIDLTGRIKSYALHQPPLNMNCFDSFLVTDQLMDLYKAALTERR